MSNTLLQDILTGKYDNDLCDIHAIVSTRMEKLRNPNTTGFKVGAQVFFNNKVNPQYLRGMGATIVKVNRKRVKVKLDRPVGRFQGIINCPTNLLEVI